MHQAGVMLSCASVHIRVMPTGGLSSTKVPSWPSSLEPTVWCEVVDETQSATRLPPTTPPTQTAGMAQQHNTYHATR